MPTFFFLHFGSTFPLCLNVQLPTTMWDSRLREQCIQCKLTHLLRRVRFGSQGSPAQCRVSIPYSLTPIPGKPEPNSRSLAGTRVDRDPNVGLVLLESIFKIRLGPSCLLLVRQADNHGCTTANAKATPIPQTSPSKVKTKKSICCR
jgi:hypothetical protein